MGKWTSAGFVTSYANVDGYKRELQAAFLKAFGDDFLLDDALPQGVLIQELAEILYAADMDGIEALSRMNINTATGIYLDLIGNLRGIRRILGTKATVTATITSKVESLPYTIPADATFTCTDSGESFVPVSPVNVTSAITSISLEAENRGEVSAAIENTMTTAINNITDVVITAVAQGAGTEEDITYRNRIVNNYVVADNTIQSIVNLLRGLDCVKTAGVEYNDTSAEAGGIPAYCTEFMAVPKAGWNQTDFRQKVAKTILDNKCPGSPTHGNTTVQVNDVFGGEKLIKFTGPTEKKIEIEVSISTPETTGIIDLSGVDSIRNTIKTYIDSLGIGKDVSYARCLAPLAADPGFDITTFKIRAKGDQSWIQNTNYSIGIREYATIEVSDIKIGV